MMQRIKRFFSKKPAKKEYSSLSDFLRNASDEEQREMFLGVARRATEDQRKLMQEAKSRT